MSVSSNGNPRLIIRTLVYVMMIGICFMPFMKPYMALGVGILFSLLNFRHTTFSQHSSPVLKTSIVLMGFGMSLLSVIEVSKTGVWATLFSVALVMVLAILLGKWLRVDSRVSLLIGAGTAICGASAIAAMAPVIRAQAFQISFSLAVVFILNAIALIVMPPLGTLLGLSQEAFGYWAGIAIHDTSSVVGAGAVYGEKALEVATTVKLVRALWIIPLILVVAAFQQNQSKGKMKIPWFIALFAASILFVYWVPQWDSLYQVLYYTGRQGMVVALFLVGSHVRVEDIRQAGTKSLFLGVMLWFVIGASAYFLLGYWVVS